MQFLYPLITTRWSSWYHDNFSQS